MRVADERDSMNLDSWLAEPRLDTLVTSSDG